MTRFYQLFLSALGPNAAAIFDREFKGPGLWHLCTNEKEAIYLYIRLKLSNCDTALRKFLWPVEDDIVCVNELDRKVIPTLKSLLFNAMPMELTT